MACFLCAGACGENRARIEADELPPPAGRDAGQVLPPPDDPWPDALMLVGVQPGHGPFSGGNTVVLRGAGLRDDAVVRFGAVESDPASLVLEDENRLHVTVPAGEPGSVDVTVLVGSTEVRLAAGYAYDPVSISPVQGSVAGGTRIEISAFDDRFTAADQVSLGGVPCGAVTLVSPRLLRCTTPPSSVGKKDLVIASATGPELELAGAYEYLETAEALGAGLRGGPIAGAINVVVFDDRTGDTVPDALVTAEWDAPLSVFTDGQGRATLSADGLLGPVTVHVAKRCYETTSFVGFDAQDATVLLRPWSLISCLGSLDPPELDPDALPGGVPDSPGGVGQVVATIAGTLVFPGPEFGPSPWDRIPAPREGEERVAYVFTTEVRRGVRNPAPDAFGGTRARIVEGEIGEEHYRIVARPDALAVYALAGIERTDDSRAFTPYVMGVTRGIVLVPGQNIEGVFIDMDLPLDHRIELAIDHPPELGARGPDRLEVNLSMDLGPEGVIQRRVRGVSLDARTLPATASQVGFAAVPARVGVLASARFDVEARFFTEAAETPFSFVRARDLQEDVVTPFGPFLDVPVATQPRDGELLAEDRTLRWEYGADPDFFVLSLRDRSGDPVWRMVLPGSARSAHLPDLSDPPLLVDLDGSAFTWRLDAGRAPGFAYDAFRYDYLLERNLSHGAADTWSFLR